jgi:glycosyltransferase involved in cell wall biosynthesis
MRKKHSSNFRNSSDIVNGKQINANNGVLNSYEASRRILHSSGEMLAKLALVCPRYYPYLGGIETHVKELGERLAAREGFTVEILTTDPSRCLPGEETINNVDVKRFSCWAPNDAYYFSLQLLSYLRKRSASYDIVHAHDYQALPALFASESKSTNKLVVTPHFHVSGGTRLRRALHIPYDLYADRIFDKADHIICVSNYERTALMTRRNINKRKVEVISNGINPDEFRALKRPNARTARKSILYVGRLEQYKGIHYAVRALALLDKHIRLDIVGNGPYMQPLRQLIRSLGVERRVTFYQNLARSELLQKYLEADLLILLSKYEAFGIVVAEALAAGTPCIVAKGSALEEWIDDESCFGISYPIKIEECVTLIEKVIDKRVSRQCIPTWDDAVEQLTRTYQNL